MGFASDFWACVTGNPGAHVAIWAAPPVMMLSQHAASVLLVAASCDALLPSTAIFARSFDSRRCIRHASPQLAGAWRSRSSSSGDAEFGGMRGAGGMHVVMDFEVRGTLSTVPIP